MKKFTAIENIAMFLQEQKGSVLASWTGRMTAKAQRSLFGAFIGKGEITIDGATETIKHMVSVCFGMDYDYTVDCSWLAFGERVESGRYK